MVPDHEVEVARAKMLPLISHKAAANRMDALKISLLRLRRSSMADDH